ncbi:MAG: hypothetical protein BWX83_00436 [Candidatus Cloacimonetes bacterium ADurb.Bin117]|nr:MAG: hypothetical protein BWX83_00436 [Candidatus Cloacimonetes bacterium ADurb.Bin117]
MQQLVQLVGLHAQQGCLFVNLALAHEVHCHFHHGETGAFAVAGLQHPELAFLDGEFDVLHILGVVLKLLLGGEKLLIDPGHRLFQGGIFCGAFGFGNPGQFSPALRAYLRDLLRGADSRHHVFALGVDEVFAVEKVLAGGGVAGEGHAGGAGFAHVAENHGLNVHSGAPVVRDAVKLAVEDGAVVVPAIEHGENRAPKLFPGVIRKIVAGVVFHCFLEAGHQFFQISRAEFEVLFHALFLFHLVDEHFKGVVFFFAGGFEAQNHVAVHLHEAAVAVPGETFVAGLFDDAVHGVVIHSEVQDGVHHARHGSPAAAADGEQKGIFVGAETHVHQAFDILHGALHLGQK